MVMSAKGHEQTLPGYSITSSAQASSYGNSLRFVGSLASNQSARVLVSGAKSQIIGAKSQDGFLFVP
jgi:hypothetical protein